MQRIQFATEYAPGGLRAILTVPDGEGDVIVFELTPARLRDLAREAHAAAHAVEWDAADWLWIGGPPHHLIRKGDGRTLCGHAVDERKGNPWSMRPDGLTCKRCTRQYAAIKIPIEL